MRTVKIKSFITKGIEAIPVEVSVSIADGIGIHLVGVQDISVKEILLRATTALMSLGYKIPGRKIVIEVKAADGKPVTCCASNLDLPVAVGILTASGQWKEPLGHLNDFAIVGELGLDGRVRPVVSELAMALASDRIILPLDNAATLAHRPGVEDHGRVYAVSGLNEVGVVITSPEQHDALDVAQPRTGRTVQENDADTAFIDGASNVRKALLIAAAGGHDINLGTTKGGFLARCLHSILPRLTEEQYIETEKIYETRGMHLPTMAVPPLREPHPLTPLSEMVGGGVRINPGEISLAHNGMIVLKDIDDYPKGILDAIRLIKDAGCVNISRLSGRVQYPADFLLMGTVREAGTKKAEGLFDLSYHADDFSVSGTPAGASSEELRERVEKARAIQSERYAGEEFKTNARLKGEALDRYCNLSDTARQFIGKLPAPPEFDNAGNISRLKRVARTIADLESDEKVEPAHILEAVGFVAMT